MNASQTLARTALHIPMVPGANVEAYLTAIAAFPLLTATEEHVLAMRLIDEDDVNAAMQLVMSQLRLVVHVAKGYSGYGLPIGDLIQEGNVGLLIAVKRFRPEAGARLVTFALHYIRSTIHEHILRNCRMVKIASTKAQRKLFFNLRRQKKSRTWLTQDEITYVAASLGVEPRDVREMESRLSGNDTSFDPGCDDDDETAYKAPAGYLEDSRYDPAQIYERDASNDQAFGQLNDALSGLDERSRDILNQRWLAEEKSTLQELASQYQVSAERIRQLEKMAMTKVRTAISLAA